MFHVRHSTLSNFLFIAFLSRPGGAKEADSKGMEMQRGDC